MKLVHKSQIGTSNNSAFSVEPTEQDALRILQEALGKVGVHIVRFTTGLSHYVYEVRMADGEQIVVRLAHSQSKPYFVSALYWYPLLLERGVPLPKLYYSQLNEDVHGFPVMILERLPGDDLGDVYVKLTNAQKRELAGQLINIQEAVATLPQATGFGFARDLKDSGLSSTWKDVLHALLRRSRERMAQTQIFPTDWVDQLSDCISEQTTYFTTIKPIAYLDDVSTKNVIVSQGALSGVIDADEVSFGDKLMTIALTKVGLLSSGLDDSYVQYWLALLNLTDEQKHAFDTYTCLYCLDFLSEVGQRFNQDKAPAIDQNRVSRLLALYKETFEKALINRESHS